MNALRNIRNPVAVLRLAPKRPRLVPGNVWPNNLPAPLLVRDTEAKARAVSLLASMPTRDGERVHASDLTAAQARDVVSAFPSPTGAEPATIPAAASGGLFSSKVAP